jgi:hypothetical protein
MIGTMAARTRGLPRFFGVVLAAALLLLVAAAGRAEAQDFAPGARVQVKWKGSWYNATVLRVRPGPAYLVHYDGYASSWDEWVGPGRIKARGVPLFPPGALVSVLWKGKWYPATVLRVKGGPLYFVHYDGYGSNWDEWVGPGRIRTR